METDAYGQTLPVCRASKRRLENSISSKIMYILSVEILSDIFVVVSTCRGLSASSRSASGQKTLKKQKAIIAEVYIRIFNLA